MDIAENQTLGDIKKKNLRIKNMYSARVLHKNKFSTDFMGDWYIV